MLTEIFIGQENSGAAGEGSEAAAEMMGASEPGSSVKNEGEKGDRKGSLDFSKFDSDFKDPYTQAAMKEEEAERKKQNTHGLSIKGLKRIKYTGPSYSPNPSPTLDEKASRFWNSGMTTTTSGPMPGNNMFGAGALAQPVGVGGPYPGTPATARLGGGAGMGGTPFSFKKASSHNQNPGDKKKPIKDPGKTAPKKSDTENQLKNDEDKDKAGDEQDETMKDDEEEK